MDGKDRARSHRGSHGWSKTQTARKGPLSPRAAISVAIAVFILLMNFWVLGVHQSSLTRPKSRLQKCLFGRQCGKVPPAPVRSNPRLTIFTVLKELLDEAELLGPRSAGEATDRWFARVQVSNAVGSWLALPGVEVVGFGQPEDCRLLQEELAAMPPLLVNRAGFRCVGIQSYEQGMTYARLFKAVQTVAQSPLVAYVDSSIILFEDLLKAVDKVEEEGLEKFLLTARPTDMPWVHRIDFKLPDWQQQLHVQASRQGSQHQDGELSIGLFHASAFPEMPASPISGLLADGPVRAFFSSSPKHAVVDATAVLHALYQNHRVPGLRGLANCTAVNAELKMVTPWTNRDCEEANRRLASVDPEDLKVKASDAKILLLPSTPGGTAKGACPDCRMVRNDNQTLSSLLQEHSRNSTVIIGMATAADLGLALNWHCSLQRMGMGNHFLLAPTPQVYEELKSRSVPAYFVNPVWVAKGANLTEPLPARVEANLLLALRAKVVLDTLRKGVNVILSDVDVVFLRDVMRQLDGSLDLQGMEGAVGIVDSGLLFLRSQQNVITMWREVFYLLKYIVSQQLVDSAYQPVPLNAFMTKLLSTSDIAAGTWPPQVVADGKRFFVDKVTQKKGEWPVAIHNNWAQADSDKEERLRNSSLWMLDQEMACVPFPLPPPPRSLQLELPGSGGWLSGRRQGSEAGVPKPVYLIKILSSYRPECLDRLLKSLRSADFGWFSDPVSLDILVDKPGNTTELFGAWQANIDVARRFKWPYGPKKVIAWTENQGLLASWSTCWLPKSLNEVAFIFEDDMVVAKPFFRWTHAAVSHYYLSDQRYDPRMYGVMLQSQHLVVGDYKFPSNMSDILKDVNPFYLAQQPSTWGPVLFPSHWLEFLAWLRQQPPGFMPMFSKCATNDWFKARGGGKSVWSSYFIRFIAERGWYSLYTHFAAESAMVVNYRPKGTNFAKDLGPSSPAVTRLEPYMLQFPNSTKDMQLFDFQFNQLKEDANILEGRGRYTDIWNVELH